MLLEQSLAPVWGNYQQKNYTPPPKNPEYKPELDSNGFKKCRLTVENGSLFFLTKKKKQTLKNVKFYTVTHTASGQVVEFALPTRSNPREFEKNTDFISYPPVENTIRDVTMRHLSTLAGECVRKKYKGC